jgi:hypothetical protein
MEAKHHQMKFSDRYKIQLFYPWRKYLPPGAQHIGSWKLLSCGMKRRVDWKIAVEISEGPTASTFRVKENFFYQDGDYRFFRNFASDLSEYISNDRENRKSRIHMCWAQRVPSSCQLLYRPSCGARKSELTC